MNLHHVFKVVSTGPETWLVQIYQLLLGFIFMYYVFIMTTVVIGSTGWWLNTVSLEPHCLALYPGSIPGQLCYLGQVI